MSNKQNTPAKLGKLRRADPFFEREQAKYLQPLPSREYILQILVHGGVPLEFDRICAQLAVQPNEFEAFRRRLDAMAREGQLMQNRSGAWLIPDKADLIRGRVEGHPDGFGFLVPDEGGGDLFLAPKEMEKVLPGARMAEFQWLVQRSIVASLVMG